MKIAPRQLPETLASFANLHIEDDAYDCLGKTLAPPRPRQPGCRLSPFFSLPTELMCAVIAQMPRAYDRVALSDAIAAAPPELSVQEHYDLQRLQSVLEYQADLEQDRALVAAAQREWRACSGARAELSEKLFLLFGGLNDGQCAEALQRFASATPTTIRRIIALGIRHNLAAFSNEQRRWINAVGTHIGTTIGHMDHRNERHAPTDQSCVTNITHEATRAAQMVSGTHSMPETSFHQPDQPVQVTSAQLRHEFGIQIIFDGL